MIGEIKNLVHHSFVYWIGVMLAKIVGFLLIPIYTRYLTPADYGTIELLFLTADVAALVICMQMSQGVFRFYHQYETQNEKSRLISTALISMLALGIAMAIGFNILARPLTLLIFGSEAYINYFRFFSSVYPICVIIEIPFTLIRIKKQSKLYVFYSFINFLCMVSLNIFFLVYMGWGIWGVLVGSAITYGGLAIFLLYRTFSEVGFSFSFEMIRHVLKFSIPLIPASVGMFVLHFSDRYFVKHFCSLSDVGIYSLGYKFGFILSGMVIQPFNLVWQTYMYEIARKPDRGEIYGRVLTYLTFALILFALVVCVPIEEVIRIIAPPQFYRASGVVPVVTFAYVLNGINLVFQTGLLISGKTPWIGSITFFSAIINLIANYFLVSALGITGAAISTLITFFLMTAGISYISLRVCPIKVEYLRIAKIFFAAVIVFFVSRILEIQGLLIALIIRSCLILAFPVLLFVLNFFNISEKQRVFEFKQYVASKFI